MRAKNVQNLYLQNKCTYRTNDLKYRQAPMAVPEWPPLRNIVEPCWLVLWEHQHVPWVGPIKQVKTNGRGMDKRMENKNWPLLKAVVKLVLNLLIASQKGYSNARKGRQKSNTGGKKALWSTWYFWIWKQGKYIGEESFNKCHDFSTPCPPMPRCPSLDTKCWVKWTSGLTKNGNSCVVWFFKFW